MSAVYGWRRRAKTERSACAALPARAALPGFQAPDRRQSVLCCRGRRVRRRWNGDRRRSPGRVARTGREGRCIPRMDGPAGCRAQARRRSVAGHHRASGPLDVGHRSQRVGPVRESRRARPWAVERTSRRPRCSGDGSRRRSGPGAGPGTGHRGNRGVRALRTPWLFGMPPNVARAHRGSRVARAAVATR